MKKQKVDTSQTVKKGKGKRKDSSSESEEASESEAKEIEAMFAGLQNQRRKSESNQLKGGVSIASGE